MRVRSRLSRFGVAAAAPLIAAGVGLWLQEQFGYRLPVVIFYPALIGTAWLCGLWPGVAATALSVVLLDQLWLRALQATGATQPSDIIGLVRLAAIGVAVSGVSESLHRRIARENFARTKAEEG